MKTTKPLVFTIVLLCSFFLNASAQIATNSNPPYNSSVYLVDSLLLGEGVVATNHLFQGDPVQIGFFNGENSNIGLDSGIVMGTGDIVEIVPGAFGGFFANAVADPDLLEVANSVPGLIDQNFNVTSVNDVAILEFDFVPVSSYLSFKYVFASEEYFAYENTQFNDVFGFFISGPNIVGPYSSPPEFPDGSINIATFESQEPNSLGEDLPITISSVNATYNPQLFVSNQNNGANTVNATVDGFTTVITAEANVVCGETYHIRLAIADGTDTGLSSFVLLEAGSFSSPPLTVINSLEIDSNKIFTDCGAPVTLTANVEGDDFEFLWNTGETTQSIIATPGYYWVQATDATGCTVQSDSLRVYSQPVPEIVLPQEDYYCEDDVYLINPVINSGTAPFTFDWGAFGNDSQIEIDESGVYSLTVVDSNGCSDTHTIELFENPLPEISYSPQEILICGGIPVEVNAFGANTYVWSPDVSLSSDTGSTIEISTLSSITYTLEGIDTIGCSSTILVPTIATDDFDLDFGISPVSCQGYSNGSITILPQSTAVSPIQYSIDGGQNYFDFFTFDNLEFGNYDIKVKDGIGCVISDNVVVESAQPEIQVLTSSIDVECSSDSTGVIMVEEISGGNVSDGYSYTWFNSGTNEVVGTDSILNVPAGGYYLVVEDDNGCQSTDEVSLTQPNPITYSYTKNDVTCHEGNDGQIIVNVNGGGTPPYQFDWVNFGNAHTNYLYNLEDGTYHLEISDANDCVSSLNVEITQSPAPLTMEVESLGISCFGAATGSAHVVVNGGTPPYFYHWSSGHVTDVAEQIPSGNYSIEVIDSRGCSVMDSVYIGESDEIISELSSTSATCFGVLDGTATISSSGGTGELTYTWSNGENSSSITSGFGEYWVIVEDELGCITEDTIFINQPQKLRADLSITDVNCFGGSDGQIEADVTGGTPYNNGTYTYSWTLDSDTIGYNYYILNSLISSPTPYVLNIVDYNGCNHTAYAFIDQPPSISLEVSEIVPTYCLNIPAGQASVVASGGFLNPEGSYSFNWNTGDLGSVLSNQTSGVYTVIVEDDNSCKDTLDLEIPLEDNFTLDINSSPLNCYEDGSGSAIVSSVGGFGPYTYDWNTSEGIVSQQMSPVSSNTILNLSQGVTSVVVTDVNGCAKTTQVNLQQPDQLVYSIFKENDESCSGEFSACDGELDVVVEGGTGMYTINCINATNSIIATNQTDSSTEFSSLCADFYQITVADEHGCSGTLSGSGLPLPVEIIAGTPVESAINTSSGSIINDILCYGDTAATLSVSNPNPSFNYEWYVNGELLASGLSAVLPAGDIQLRAVSSPSCYTNSETLTIYQPSQLSIIQEVESVNCNGDNNGSISIEASGGFPTYSYSWSNMGNSVEGSTDLMDLSAGIYTLTLEDANNCERQFDIEIVEPLVLSANSTVQDVTCNGSDDGSATVSIAGGVSPYSINWQGADSTSLSADTYVVLITDANNCPGSIEVEVNQPTAVVASFNANQVPFTASATGGTPPYIFEWLYFGNYQSSGTTFTPTEDGEYTLVAIDNNDCEGRNQSTYSNTVSVSELDGLEVLVYPNPVKDNLIVEVTSQGDVSDDYNFKLVDYRGRVIRDETFKKQIKINRDNIAKGFYIIMISSQGKNYKEKILFE